MELLRPFLITACFALACGERVICLGKRDGYYINPATVNVYFRYNGNAKERCAGELLFTHADLYCDPGYIPCIAKKHDFSARYYAKENGPLVPPTKQNHCQRVVCTYSNRAQYRGGAGSKYLPQDINPSLCTHIIYSHARLKNGTVKPSQWNDVSSPKMTGNYEKVVNLKDINPDLKILLSVRGHRHGPVPVKSVVATESLRAAFISSTIEFLRKHNFDGLDLSWGYPNDQWGPPESKNDFTALVRELRAAFQAETKISGKESLLLTATLPVPKLTVDMKYDIAAISKDADFINLISFNFGGNFGGKTGHHSALYARGKDTGKSLAFNVDWAARYVAHLGCPKSKLVIGVPFYGHSFTLTSSNKGLRAPARKGFTAPFTKTPGFIAYYEVCTKIKQDAEVKFISDQKVPYLVSGNQWVAYENPQSVKEKVEFVKAKGYTGLFVWSLDLDDFDGRFCEEGSYPLLNSIVRECYRS